MISPVMPTYARADLAFERGDGCWLESVDGKRFLDFGAGVAVTALGHAHPRLVAALSEQAQKLWHCSNLYRVPGQERVAKTLIEKSFADTVFFCNSGAEAMECALKMVRKYQDAVGAPERYRCITVEGAFHGRTLATIAAGGQEKHLKGFDPVVDGFDYVPFGNMNALRAAITPETAAIVIEPIQGEGGIRPSEIDYLKKLRIAADEFGLLLVFDEVQTGMGRTGSLFAYEQAGVVPDVMALAKGLGGGFPVGACLASEKAAQGMTAGTHGSTFGGNPLAMAVAETVLDVMQEPSFLPEVLRKGKLLKAKLEDLAKRHPASVKSVRGQGLMLGLVCVRPNTEIVEAGYAQGLLTIVAGDNVVRILPPLIVSDAEIEEGCAKLEAALTALESRGA
jgi:acetylornithine/N-succinyldiaminopimelate aminotransferase